MRSILTAALSTIVALCLSAPGWAACTRTGTAETFSDNANSGSTSVTVPSDATLMVVAVSGYRESGYFSSGTMTIGGAGMTVLGADSSALAFMGALFYRVNPSIGSQTLAWDWLGSGVPTDGVLFAYAFYKGIDTTTPTRDTFAGQFAEGPYVTDTLTAVSGDCVVAGASPYVAANPPSTTWWNATEIALAGYYRNAAVSLAEAFPSANLQLQFQEDYDSDGALAAIVFRVAGAGPSGPPYGTLTLLGVGR